MPGPRTPPPDDPTGLVAGVLIGVAGAGVGLYFAAKLFPAHPKTLARDSVLVGFFGAALLVEQLARGAIAQFRRIAAVAIAVGPPVVVLIASGHGATRIIGFVLAGVTLLQLLVNPASGPWSPVTVNLPSINPDSLFGKYGPIALGLALLLLGVFLQLRSIHYSTG